MGRSRPTSDDPPEPDYELDAKSDDAAEESQTLPVDPDELWLETLAAERLAEQRYSLRELLSIVTIVSVGLAVSRFLKLDIVAAVLGAFVVLGMVLLWTDTQSRWLRLAWFTLLVLYVGFSLMAALL